jgi:agmatinase
MATRFLAARTLEELPSPAIVLLGVPWDGSVSWRHGAAQGPRAIRDASESIEEFSLRQRRSLRDVPFADAGDVPLPEDAAGVVSAVANAVERWARQGTTVVTLGGDHSISIGTARGLHRVYPDLAHVVFDAHFDFRLEYDGSPFSHACGTRRMAELGPTVLLGARSAAEEEFADAERLSLPWSSGLTLPPSGVERLLGRPLHISLDCDVLDPSVLPGTGNPEPGGAAFLDLLKALEAVVREFQVVAVDVCEAAPPLDPSGMSAVTAASLVREILLLLGARGVG